MRSEAGELSVVSKNKVVATTSPQESGSFFSAERSTGAVSFNGKSKSQVSRNWSLSSTFITIGPRPDSFLLASKADTASLLSNVYRNQTAESKTISRKKHMKCVLEYKCKRQ